MGIVVALGALSSAYAQPTIQVTPSDVVEGRPVHVVASGFDPGQIVTIRATRAWAAYPAGEDLYRSAASFVADERGAIDLRTDVPLAGSSYQVADPAGIFWSMIRQQQARTDQSGHPVPGVVQIEAETNGLVVARAEARLRLAAADVTVREVREPDVAGVFAQGRRPGRQPAIIVLGGSEGGLFTARWAAPILASHGYAVLGLGYFQGDEPVLSTLPANLEKIPLETLERARDWLARQDGVDASRIAMVGVSKGAELALVSATLFPWVAAVGAFAPSHVVWEGIPARDQQDRAAGSSWTYREVALPYVRWSRGAEQRGDFTRQATGSSRLVEPHLESLALFAGDVPAATIAIERSRAALFIAAGMDDGMWPSAYSAERLRERLSRRGSGTPSVFEIHPTGHLVMGTGWAPTTQFQRSRGRLQGGNAALDAKAQSSIWPAFLQFLDEHFRAASPSVRSSSAQDLQPTACANVSGREYGGR
jgi:dienelactone hydrolase